MTARLLRVLLLSALAVLLAGLDGSALFLVLPAVAAEFHARVAALAGLGSAVALGSIGSLPLGILADRVGRRRVIAASMLLFGAADLATAVAPSLAWLTAGRIVAAAFETLTVQAALVLVVEESPPVWRGRAAAAISLAAGIGIAGVTVVYPFLAPHWRLVYVAGGAAIPAALATWFLLPESGTWLAAARVPVSEVIALVRAEPWRGRLAVVSLSAALGAVLFQPAGLFLAVYAAGPLHMGPGLISAIVIVSGAAGTSGYVIGGMLSDRAGRRLPGVSLAMVAALGAALTFAGGVAPLWAGSIIWTAAASASGPVFAAWFAELFPTRGRVSAQAVNSVAAALGGVAGLQVVGLLEARTGVGRAILVTVLAGVVAAGLLLLLPETRGRPLPE